MLIDPKQGNMLFIDFTEAKLFDPVPSTFDLQLARTFIDESRLNVQIAVSAGKISQSDVDMILTESIQESLKSDLQPRIRDLFTDYIP